MSPQFFKVLVTQLHKILNTYEAQFGVIPHLWYDMLAIKICDRESIRN